MTWRKLVAFIGALLLLSGCDTAHDRRRESGPQRIVSLSPALTETLFAIGAGNEVVGVSDYCDYPARARELPRAGTSITPKFEKIAALKPTVIVTEQAVNARSQELERLARPVVLPWLSLEQVVSGVRRLGELTGNASEAQRLATSLERSLKRTPPRDAPRVLLVLGYGSGQLGQVWFIRRNSIHGAALRAAGANNAVDRDVKGQPRLSLEEVIRVDPDAVVVLLNDKGPEPEKVIAAWQAVQPLRAVKEGKVRAIKAPEAFSNGPRILGLVDRLRATIEGLAGS